MRAAFSAADVRPDLPLLDEEVWEVPRRIGHDELFDHIDPGWRPGCRPPDDAEYEQ